VAIEAGDQDADHEESVGPAPATNHWRPHTAHWVSDAAQMLVQEPFASPRARDPLHAVASAVDGQQVKTVVAAAKSRSVPSSPGNGSGSGAAEVTPSTATGAAEAIPNASDPQT